MQSILQKYCYDLSVPIAGPETVRRWLRLGLIYMALYGLACLLALGPFGDDGDVFAAGLLMPGGGFFRLAVTGDLMGMVFAVGWIALFIIAVALWFATGNVILPPLVWTLSAIMAVLVGAGSDAGQNEAPVWALFLLAPTTLLLVGTILLVNWRIGLAKRTRLNETIAASTNIFQSVEEDTYNKPDELSLEDLKRLRLLLDRALQPSERFEGFERLDQFQTASLRYQINFISYALSIVQAIYCPGATAYLHEAQARLKAKQENHSIWGYWGLENAWGNLRLNDDPVAQDNIMYSGFVAAQLAYAQNAGSNGLGPLACQKAGVIRHCYTLNEMITVLRDQYRSASYGLLPCEPNWIYPLCNAITASAIRAQDAAQGTQHWQAIAPRYRRFLETEFMTTDGRLVPFRSSYTGIAAPQVGGAVMQAFPCFFLNTVFPDMAQRQWLALREDVKGKSWRRALWPVDVGNYRFSRASSYGATALAARELGDHDVVDELLQSFEMDCPAKEIDGRVHHQNASLWAHANVFMARIGRHNMLRALTTTRPNNTKCKPHISDANYPDILIAKAKGDKDTLDIVLYPGGAAGTYPIGFAGLVPRTLYQCTGSVMKTFRSGPNGTASLDVFMNSRTSLKIQEKEG